MLNLLLIALNVLAADEDYLGQHAAGYVCGVFDGEDAMCENINECAAVMITEKADLRKADFCDTGNTAGACMKELDSLSRAHGHCVPKEGHEHRRLAADHCASHSHSSKACRHPDSKHLCEWDDAAAENERCFLAGTRGIFKEDGDDEHDHDEGLFCGIFKLGEDCLSPAAGGHCAWEQHCEGNGEVCESSKDTCEANPICIMTDKGCELEALERNFYTSKWLAAMTVLIVTCVGIAVPWIGERFFEKCYNKVRPFLETASCAVLYAISIIHLLSESQIYSGNIDMVGQFNPWLLFGIATIGTLIINYVCDFMANQGQGISHNHDNLQQPAKSVKVLAVMYVAIMIHGIQEGVVLGIQNAELTWTMTTVMLLHKLLFTITISQGLKANPTKVHIALVCAFALSTPVAIVIAAYSIETTNNELFAYLNAFSAGTLLVFGLECYLALPHAHEPETIVQTTAAVVSQYDAEPAKPSENDENYEYYYAVVQTGSSPAAKAAGKQDSSKKVFAKLFGHFVVTITIGLMVFGLMVWHLSVHDHGAIGEEGGHEGHDHAH